MRFFALLLLLVGVFAADPQRLRVNFGANGIQTFLTSAVNYVNKNFKTVNVGDVEESVSTPIGSVAVYLTNIRLTKLSLASSSIGVDANAVATGNIKNLAGRIEFSWRYRKKSWPHISDHGTGYAEASGSAALKLQFSTTSDGKPAAKVNQANADIGSLKLHLSGGASWLYNIFIKLFTNSVKKAINSKLNSVINSALQNAFNSAFNKFPTSISIKKEAWKTSIDSRMNSIVTVNSRVSNKPTFLSFGSVFNVADCPYTAANMPAVLLDSPLDDQALLEVQVDNSFLQCLLWSANSQNAIFTTVSSTVAAWAQALPSFTNYFPSDAPIKAEVSIMPGNEPKVAMTNSTGLQFIAPVSLKLNVAYPNGTTVLAVHFRVDVQSQIALFLETHGATTAHSLLAAEYTMLTGKVQSTQLKLGLIQSNIGSISVNIMNALIKVLLPPAEKMINSVLADGIPLPLPEVLRITYTDVDYQDGFVKFVTAFQLPS